MVADVSHHFPLRLPAPTPKALYSPCEIRHLAIIVNLEYDPTAAFRNQWCTSISVNWMFSASAKSKNA